MTENELITKRLKGVIVRMDRTYKGILKAAWKQPDCQYLQGLKEESGRYWRY